MPRLVCLYIEDNDAAQAFVDETVETGGGFYVGEGTETIEGVMAPIAMFAVPTLYCECPPSTTENPHRITRGAKFGWWMHRQEGCMKPKPNSWQSPKNLLTPQGEFSKVYVNWTYQAPPTHLPSSAENGSVLSGGNT
jgi:hypothetical protein